MKKSFCVIMSLIIIVLSLPVCIIGVGAASAHTYYIDSVGGSNTNSGDSEDSAWKDLGGFTNADFSAGDKVLFKAGGTYECSVVLTGIQGTKENPFVISSYGEGTPPVLYTNEAREVFTFIDCSYVTVSNVNITAPNGGGIWIDTLNSESVGIVLDGIYFYNMPNGKVNSRDNTACGAAAARAAVMVKGLPARSRYAVNDLTIKNCEVYNCANGFLIWGSWNDEQNPWCEEEDADPIFNTGVLITDCYLHDMDAEAVIIGICDGAKVTRCRAINTCQGEGVDENGKVLYYTAAMWFWGAVNSTFSYCEIAGQKNVGDGMTVDFDSQSHNCTYEYIYSHDNQRFIVNNAKTSAQQNNTVRYCLSVNDNKGKSCLASGSGENGFKFYNNTIVNCGEFLFRHLTNSYVANNIFVFADGNIVKWNLKEELKGNNNVYENNCYYNTLTPILDLFAMNTNPAFANAEGIDAYKLAVNSPLISAGSRVDDGITVDFFGNEITSANIGCYGGKGEEPEVKTQNIFEKLIAFFKNLLARIKYEIIN